MSNLHRELRKFEKLEDGTYIASTEWSPLKLSVDNAKARFKNSGSWFELSLESYGRAGNFRTAGPASVSSSGERINLSRKGMTEWYVNHGENLEHGLVLNEKPSGRGNLVVSFSTAGNLSPEQRDKDIAFVGERTMNYSAIKS